MVVTAGQTPESIMMSTMTDNGDEERRDRAVVVPWLKFLWETYRTVLDILRTNSNVCIYLLCVDFHPVYIHCVCFV